MLIETTMGAPAPYLTALPTRLVTTWSMRLWSQNPIVGPLTFNSIRLPLSAAVSS